MNKNYFDFDDTELNNFLSLLQPSAAQGKAMQIGCGLFGVLKHRLYYNRLI